MIDVAKPARNISFLGCEAIQSDSHIAPTWLSNVSVMTVSGCLPIIRSVLPISAEKADVRD
jgi:hypothetical protein